MNWHLPVRTRSELCELAQILQFASKCTLGSKWYEANFTKLCEVGLNWWELEEIGARTGAKRFTLVRSSLGSIFLVQSVASNLILLFQFESHQWLLRRPDLN